MICKTYKEECTALRNSINLFNKAKIPYSSANYLFIVNVVGYRTRQINDKDTAEQSTPQVNNAEPTKKKSTLHSKMLFKGAGVLLPHI